ncbi:hypothetical protein [Streptomyces sp. NPDC058045]|uniref:hypothetical protein n=1 Tax=Streptomyces sp. NPDC058045 TaxID=3346311 RepID=UPI0036E8E18F
MIGTVSKNEAPRAGHDDALLLDDRGTFVEDTSLPAARIDRHAYELSGTKTIATLIKGYRDLVDGRGDMAAPDVWATAPTARQ